MLSGIKKLDPEKDLKQIMKRGKSVLYHIFNNHMLFENWCYYIQEKQKGITYTNPNTRGYYTKWTHSDKYDGLQTELENVCTKKVL